jgi:predicted Zn-dependent protease with MMP-like domain
LSRSEQFDEHVRAALQRLNRQWERRLEKLEVAVEDVPPGEAATWDATIPFGRAVPALSGQPDRLILYRRPIEARAYDSHDLGLLVLDVIVQQLAQLWNMPPTSVDPGYRD